MEKIPFFKPSIGNEEINAATDIIRSRYMTMGPKVAEFEHEFGKYIGNKYCVATNSLTNGYLILLNYLKPEWLTMPSMTYISMANIPRIFGIEIELRDTVHVGHAYPIFTDKGIIVDSAHEIERNICKGTKDYWLFSFYANKSMTTGGAGGMIICPDKKSYDYLRHARKNGVVNNKETWEYDVEVPGWCAYMTDLNASIGIEQLKKMDIFNTAKQMIVYSYNEQLGENNTSLHLYTIYVKKRDKFINYMKKNNVECSVHYKTPIHMQPAFKDNKTKLPYTEDVAKKTVSLPLYPDLLEYKNVKHICDLVNDWRRKNV